MKVTTLEETLPKVQYIIEATSFEQHCLWEKYHDRVEWKQHLSGHGKIIGRVDDRPIFMSFLYASIDGVLVLFWTLTSELADYNMAEKFLKEHTKVTSRFADAQNNFILHLKKEE